MIFSSVVQRIWFVYIYFKFPSASDWRCGGGVADKTHGAASLHCFIQGLLRTEQKLVAFCIYSNNYNLKVSPACLITKRVIAPKRIWKYLSAFICKEMLSMRWRVSVLVWCIASDFRGHCPWVIKSWVPSPTAHKKQGPIIVGIEKDKKNASLAYHTKIKRPSGQ